VNRAFATALLLLYLPLSRTAFSLFNCKPLPDGRSVMQAEPSLLCYEQWWHDMYAEAVVATMLYALGIPLMMMMILFVAR
jgi:hypothetical protein